MESVIFYILAFIALAGALGVILARNPVASALGLVLAFLALAGIYLTLGAEFLAVIQILVYAGGIMVLFLFVILLVNQDVVFGKLMTPSRMIVPAIIILLGVGWAVTLAGAEIPNAEMPNPEFPNADTTEGEGSGSAAGKILYTKYIFPFETASVILLAAMIGAVVLAKKRRVE